MPAINTIIGTQYSYAEYVSVNGDFDSATNTSLSGSMTSPYIEGHIVTFKEWVVVVPKPRPNQRRQPTPKCVPVFVDKTANTEVQIWLSYFAKTAKSYPNYKDDNAAHRDDLTAWNCVVLKYGGELGEWVRANLNSSMTNKELREAFQNYVSGKEFRVNRPNYKSAHYDDNNHIVVDDADFAAFNLPTTT